jgi:hypothetical protein
MGPMKEASRDEVLLSSFRREFGTTAVVLRGAKAELRAQS